jgi:hypothetical protein
MRVNTDAARLIGCERPGEDRMRRNGRPPRKGK